MNENNLQNNQSLNNISNQNPQPVNNTNQTMNMQTNLSEVNHNTQVNSTNPTTTQTNPSPVNPTATQASPNTVSPTTTQANPNTVSPTTTQANPNTVSPTTTQTSPSPVSSTATQTSPSPVSSTTTQTSPSPVRPTTTQTSPSPVSSTTTQTSPTPVSQPTTSANINQTSSQPTNNQQELNLVNPLNPDEIVKKEILIEKEAPKENEEVNNNEENNQKPKKKKINPILLILLVVVIAAIGVIVYFTFFNNSEPDTPNTPDTPQNPDTPETPVTPQITLNDILNNFNSNENVNQLRETSEITANINNNNEIAIDVTTDGQTNSYLFTLENRDLLFEINPNDLTSNLLFLIICDNIGQFHGLDVNEVYSYLAAIDLNTTAVNGITLTQLENGNYQARINIDTKIDTSSLNTMYIEVSDLESYRDFLEGTGTVQIPKGNLMLYKEGDENTTTILIGEKDNLTSLTYNSILSVIELLYPDELENFKTSYPNLETIAFDRYTITTNPVLTGTLETLYNQYQNEYGFVLLEINKSL